MSQSVGVALAERAYEVLIGPGRLAEAGERLKAILARPLVAVVTDKTVFAYHGAKLEAALRGSGVEPRFIVLPPGEQVKTFAGLEDLCDRLLALGLDRADLIVAFGGGVVGDLAGLAAALYKRGIALVQIPTTLLAQVDSSVGGKTGIDTPRGKNLIGAFHQPRMVIADLDLLRTLPAREIACGYAEILKCALIADSDFFLWLERHGPDVLKLNPPHLEEAIARAVSMKAAIVAADEREGAGRALLNLGHTFGHALEAETGFGPALEHGEAVGLGCALAFRFSAGLGLCPLQDAQHVGAAVRAAGLPERLDEVRGHPFGAGALIGHMAQDKKARAGAISLVLARRIGEAFLARDVDRARLETFLVAEGAAR